MDGYVSIVDLDAPLREDIPAFLGRRGDLRTWTGEPDAPALPRARRAPERPEVDGREPVELGFRFDGEAPFAVPEWLVKGLLPKAGIAELAGQSGAGKTFLALDLAAAVATGEAWFGHKVLRGGVAYLAAEGEGDLPARREALKAKGPGFGSKLPLAWTGLACNLLDAEARKAVIARLRGVAIRFTAEHGAPLRLVIVDTLAAAFAVKDEDSNAEMARVAGTLREIADALGCLVVAVHHVGKNLDAGSRGATSLPAAMDAVLIATAKTDEVTGKLTGDRTLALRKCRQGPTGWCQAFALDPVELGRDADGDAVTSCVVTPVTGQPERAAPIGRPPRHAEPFTNAVGDALDAHGVARRVQGSGPEVRAVRVEHVRPYFRRHFVAGEGDAKQADAARRQAFGRMVKTARALGFATETDAEGVEWLWRVRP